MIEIILRKSLQAVIPHGLQNAKGSLLLCQKDNHGRILITEFTEYCSRAHQEHGKEMQPTRTGDREGK